MRNTKSAIAEIEKVLSGLPARTSKQVPETYIGGGQSRLSYVGLRVPDLRRVAREGFSFSSLDHDEVAEIWDAVWWNSNCYEVLALALMWFEHPSRRKDLLRYWPRLKKWSERIDNWAHSDSLSGIYARIHEDAPSEVYGTFKKWNSSKNPWLRRLSIVSLFFYSSQRKKYPAFSRVKELLDPQLDFDHHYVQRGVGWTLREAGNVYPDETHAYLERNLARISAIAFSAATEKMAPRQRERLKRMRKTQRT